jgi:hypothetical protein
MVKKAGKWVAYAAFLTAAVLLLLELSYRMYLVDFYRNNLRWLNGNELSPGDQRPVILVVGDSFSADRNSYVAQVRKHFPHFRVINAAIPGTCIRQHNLLINKRLREFKPSVLIYQTYPGNDLFEYRHPLTGKGISLQRKVYWWLSDRLLFTGYVNSQLPQMKKWFAPEVVSAADAKAEAAFSPETYSPRTKMMLRAEPGLLQHSILLQGRRKSDMQTYVQKVQGLIARVPDSVAVFVLCIPDAVQVSAGYQEQFRQLGADLTAGDSLLQAGYPFFLSLEKNLSSGRVQMLNPLPPLQAAAANGPVYYASDPHLNAAGQAVVGEEVVAALRSVLSPPP